MTSFLRFDRLDETQKSELLDVANVFRGYRLRPSGPEPAAREIGQLRDASIRVASDLNVSTVTVASVTSERDAKYTHSCWSKAAATVSSPWVSASVEAEQSSGGSTTSTSTSTYITANYKFPHVVFRLDAKSIKPSQAFVDDVAKALQAEQPRAQQRLLNEALDYWGHVIATHVEIGCSLITTQIGNYSSLDQQSEAEQNVKASLDASVGRFSASASGGTGSKTIDEKMENLAVKSGVIDTIGGDANLSGHIAAWLKTVDDPANWAIISVGSVIHVTDILDADMQEKIRMIQTPPIFHLPWRLSCWFGQKPETPSSFIESPLNIDLTKSITVAGWCRRGGVQNLKTMIAFESPKSNSSFFRIYHYDPANHGLEAYIGDALNSDSGRQLQAKTVLPGATWQHFAVVMRVGVLDAAGERLEDKFIIYINGKEENSIPYDGGFLNLPDVRVVVGRRLTNSLPWDCWDGQIQDLKIYQRALTQAQIASDASQKPSDVGFGTGKVFG